MTDELVVQALIADNRKFKSNFFAFLMWERGIPSEHVRRMQENHWVDLTKAANEQLRVNGSSRIIGVPSEETRLLTYYALVIMERERKVA